MHEGPEADALHHPGDEQTPAFDAIDARGGCGNHGGTRRQSSEGSWLSWVRWWSRPAPSLLLDLDQLAVDHFHCIAITGSVEQLACLTVLGLRVLGHGEVRAAGSSASSITRIRRQRGPR